MMSIHYEGVAMQYFKEMGKTALSIKSIYECRKVPTIITIIFFLVINIGFTFPFAFSVISLEQVTVNRFIDETTFEELAVSDDFDFLKKMSLKDGQIINNGYDEIEEIAVGSQIYIFDYNDTLVDDDNRLYTARITKDYMEIHFGLRLYSDYTYFEDTSFDNMSNPELIDYFLIGGLRRSTGQWALPISLAFYLVFFVTNTFFVLGMSLLALIFRLGDAVKLTYRETLNIVVYASVLPIIVSIFIPLIFNAIGLNLIIYNFGTFGMYMIVRNKFLKKHLKPEEL